jgi:HTH-type transcriptional regulator/antitoxin HigA
MLRAPNSPRILNRENHDHHFLQIRTRSHLARTDYFRAPTRGIPSVLDKLASKANPTSKEEKYAEVLMALIEAYEEEHHSIPDASPVEVLRALMDANDLRQKDLVPVFGSESIVSEILHKKRRLNKAQIEKLSERFHVSPAVFF